VIDIPNAFIQTRVEDGDLRGVLVDASLEIAPFVHGPYVTEDKKGVKLLVVKCQNALYGRMVASLLFCKKFRNSLTGIGFTFNPYDPFVASKIIDGQSNVNLLSCG
jgi:hypothetical protein